MATHFVRVVLRKFYYQLNIGRSVSCRGLATDTAVRSERHLEGLLPHRRGGLQLEVDRALVAINRCTTPLQKYEVRV